jgi:hypothetical protein
MTPFRRTLSAVALVPLLTPFALAQSKNAKPPQTRQVFIAVTGDNGQPVLDVKETDFDLKEAGQARTITHAGLATSPMRIALMVDTSDAAGGSLQQLRQGLPIFLDTLGAEHEVMLITTGRQMRVRVPATLDRKKLKDAASGLFGDGAGTPLMDALLEVDKRFMSKDDGHWPVYVVVTSDGTESSAGAREKEFNHWVETLRYRAATVHALVVKQGAKPSQQGSTGGLPDIIAMNTTMNTGGRYDAIIVSNAVPDKLKTLANQINADFTAMSTRYQVDFETDTIGALKDVEAGIRRERVKMQISYQRRFP